MARLLQGEVGSGKTIIALISLILTAMEDQQGILLAPTEVLAEQHFLNISDLVGASIEFGNDEYIRKITGMSCQEYKSYLHRKWLNTFSDILSKNTLNMGVEELFACRFYALDEWCPRCSGRPSLEHGLLAQARFFAAAFSAENTQMLINKKKHAEHLGASIRR